MKLERTKDLELIKSVIFNDEIFEVISEDGMTKEDFKTDVHSDAWVLVKVKQRIIGVYVLHPQNSVALEIHAHILPEYRKKYAIQSGREILKWFLSTGYKKLVANVPDIYPNVERFCIANGFKVEGVNRLSHMKNKKLCGVVMLGITKNEIEGFLNGVR